MPDRFDVGFCVSLWLNSLYKVEKVSRVHRMRERMPFTFHAVATFANVAAFALKIRICVCVCVWAKIILFKVHRIHGHVRDSRRHYLWSGLHPNQSDAMKMWSMRRSKLHTMNRVKCENLESDLTMHFTVSVSNCGKLSNTKKRAKKRNRPCSQWHKSMCGIFIFFVLISIGSLSLSHT